MLRHEPIALDEDELYKKIVLRKRGGLCYELNGLFRWLLAQLGYRVSRIAAGVYSTERGEFGPLLDHMALLVYLEQTYLVDVGFGDTVRCPIALPNGEASDISGTYRVRRDELGFEVYVLEKKVENRLATPIPIYRRAACAE